MGLVLIIVIALIVMATPSKYKAPVVLIGVVVWLILAAGNSCQDGRQRAYDRGFYDGMDAP